MNILTLGKIAWYEIYENIRIFRLVSNCPKNTVFLSKVKKRKIGKNT